MDDYKYGVAFDLERLSKIGGGGNHLVKLDKMPEGHLTSLLNARICDIDFPVASTITARYYKGIGAHKDNMILVVEDNDDNN